MPPGTLVRLYGDAKKLANKVLEQLAKDMKARKQAAKADEHLT
jgi:hypothetical protein